MLIVKVALGIQIKGMITDVITLAIVNITMPSSHICAQICALGDIVQVSENEKRYVTH